MDAALKVSGGATSVEVTAEAAGVEVNTQTQESAQVVTPEQIAQLPSLTRNPYDFIALAGNISGGDRSSQSGNPQTSGGGQNTTDRGVGYSINGQRSSGTEILMDGVENTNLFDTTVALEIPQDTVQEFRVVTNNFDAQYGRASGGVVNVSTKSGTNTLHGSAWEYNRLSAYTANTYDNNANHVPKGQYTRNQFGYAVGGPIIKNKLFFYQSTEWLRVRSDASLLTYVPTPELIAAAAPNVQQFFQQNGNNTFPFISTVTKDQLAGKFGHGGSFDQALSGSTPVFGLVNYRVPADAGGDSPQNTYDLIARADWTDVSGWSLLRDERAMFRSFLPHLLSAVDSFKLPKPGRMRTLRIPPSAVRELWPILGHPAVDQQQHSPNAHSIYPVKSASVLRMLFIWPYDALPFLVT